MTENTKPNDAQDKSLKINQWLTDLGMENQAQSLIDKYGVEVAYNICQQSMSAPANLKDLTGGEVLNSKSAIQYFLDKEITPDFLESETGAKALAEGLGLDTRIVQKSLLGANPELYGDTPDREALRDDLAGMSASDGISNPIAFFRNRKLQEHLEKRSQQNVGENTIDNDKIISGFSKIAERGQER